MGTDYRAGRAIVLIFNTAIELGAGLGFAFDSIFTSWDSSAGVASQIIDGRFAVEGLSAFLRCRGLPGPRATGNAPRATASSIVANSAARTGLVT